MTIWGVSALFIVLGGFFYFAYRSGRKKEELRQANAESRRELARQQYEKNIDAQVARNLADYDDFLRHNQVQTSATRSEPM